MKKTETKNGKQVQVYKLSLCSVIALIWSAMAEKVCPSLVKKSKWAEKYRNTCIHVKTEPIIG